MNLRYVLLGSILILAALSGCTGGGGDGETAAPATTAAPETAAPATTAAPVAEVALHGVGKCDTCGHGAPTLKDISEGKHKNAFEKKPEIHKALCAGCHIVETFCDDCHALPSIIAPAEEAPADAAPADDEGS